MIPILFSGAGQDPYQNALVLQTTCGPDNDFYSPKKLSWSAALGKLLVAGGTLTYVHLRNYDLSFFSKRSRVSSQRGCAAVDSDASNIYWEYNNARMYKSGLTTAELDLVAYVDIANIRMIDASGDPNYVYVSSNNGTDHHGFRQVKKSTMAVTASALADGSGNGQFDDPLGIFYYNSEIFVADYDNSRISVWTKSGETLTYSRKYDLGFKPMDLCFDGTNWYVQSATTLYKYDNVFTDATKTSVANVGYSITLIPDQGDGNGATIAFTDNTNSHIGRRKCSDLTTATADVGSSGDGSASLFDPAATCVGGGTWYTDDGRSYYAASGAAPSQNGFTGIFWPSAGPHRVTFRPAGGLAAVTAFVSDSDAMTSIKNLRRCTGISGNLYLHNNNTLMFDLAGVSNVVGGIFQANGTLMYGNLSSAPRCNGLILSGCNITGSLSSLQLVGTYLYLSEITTITGALSDLYLTLQYVRLYGCTGITPASIAHLTALRDGRIYLMGWSAANNTTVLASAYNARASYTYASGIQLRIGAPTGTPGTEPPEDGVSNDDWSWNAGTGQHEPLTGYAYMFMLGNDIYSEGYKTWSVTIV
jgi:hypothetical protein